MDNKSVLTCVLTTLVLLTGCARDELQTCSGSLVKGCEPIVYFNFDSSDISDTSYETLNWMYNKLQRWPLLKVTIVGHADLTGGSDYNLNLSRKRAEAVKKYYTEKGIDSSRITLFYKGSTEPICKESKCNELNRRAITTSHNKKRLGFF